MKFFELFRKKRKTKAKRKKRTSCSSPKRKTSFGKLSSKIENMQKHVGTIDLALKKHENELVDLTKQVNNHSKGLEKLEQIVTKTQINPPAEEKAQLNRPVAMTKPPIAAKPKTKDSSQKFDLNRFSEQEKRILSVFFHNQDLALSYVDIAKTLNKSPHTVKNQMNQMKLKADLFNRTVDNDSRNRFRLKDSLKIEKYLNVG